MVYFLVGLLVFFAAHSLQIASGMRQTIVDRMGLSLYRVAYSIVSLVGIALIWFGFAQYRAAGIISLWYPPTWTVHLALLLNFFAIIFCVAAYLPCHMRRVLKHPMLVGVKIWATAHLIANGDLGGIILFGSFLAWAVLVRIGIKRRPVDAKPVNASGSFDLLALVVGCAIYAAVVFWLHPDVFNIPVWPG